MDAKFKNIRDLIIEHTSENKTLFGLPPTVRRLMIVMYYYEKPMTLDDMKEELGMSKASMSNAVRELVDIGLVEKIWIKGERKDIYKVVEDNYESFIKFFCYNWRKSCLANNMFLKKTVDDLHQLLEDDEIDQETKALVEKDLDKVYAGMEYIDWLERVIELFESDKIFNYVPKRRCSDRDRVASSLTNIGSKG